MISRVLFVTMISLMMLRPAIAWEIPADTLVAPQVRPVGHSQPCHDCGSKYPSGPIQRPDMPHYAPTPQQPERPQAPEQPQAQPYGAPQLGAYTAPPYSGAMRGPVRGLGVEGMKITLPELTLKLPSIEFPSIIRSRRNPEMILDSARAPFVGGHHALPVAPMALGAYAMPMAAPAYMPGPQAMPGVPAEAPQPLAAPEPPAAPAAPDREEPPRAPRPPAAPEQKSWPHDGPHQKFGAHQDADQLRIRVQQLRQQLAMIEQLLAEQGQSGQSQHGVEGRIGGTGSPPPAEHSSDSQLRVSEIPFRQLSAETSLAPMPTPRRLPWAQEFHAPCDSTGSSSPVPQRLSPVPQRLPEISAPPQ